MPIVKLHVKRAPMLNVKLVQMPSVKLALMLRLSGVADLVAADLVAYPDPAADLASDLAVDPSVEAMAAMVDMATVGVDVGAPLTTVE